MIAAHWIEYSASLVSIQRSIQPPTRRGTRIVSFSIAAKSVTFYSSCASARADALASLSSKAIARSPEESKTRIVFIIFLLYVMAA